MRKVRENILVTNGNQAVFAAGASIVDANGKLVPRPGQMVFYDPVTMQSVGAGITKDSNPRVVMGVAEDTNGDGIADAIRKSFGDQLYGCNINAARAKAARCGAHEVVDLLFDCVSCADAYTVHISVEDDQTQNQFPYNRPSLYSFTGKVPCGKCEGCDTDGDPTALACAIVDQINAKTPKDPTKYSFYHKAKAPVYPFVATRLYTNSKMYCLSPTALSTCENCINVPAIVSLTVDDGVNPPVTTDFTNNLNPGDSDYTLTGQLQSIVDQINTILDGNGSAVVVGSPLNCCDYQLEINSCYDVTLNTTFDVTNQPIDPCAETNPLDPVEFAKSCKNCGATSTTKTYAAGVRIFSKAIQLDCNCQYPANPPISYLGRRINVFSDGFSDTFTRKVQSMEFPEGQGYTWEYRDYVSPNGGDGRTHNPYNDHYGPLGLPGKQDRANSARVKCTESYCAYALEHTIPDVERVGVSAPARNAKGRTVVLIPSADAVTIADFEAIINPYIGSGSCIALDAITCG